MARQIKVNEKALAHLSRGLYRSPASALRELVSNAWDASAHTVRIDTNYPHFLQVVIEDDGEGFGKEEFTRLMEGGIGNSLKRPRRTKPANGRPVIGRLGIGMLGIAQICGSFTISSKTKRGDGFRARVTLYDLLKDKLDTDDRKYVRKDDNDAYKEIDVGEFEFLEFDAASQDVGTRVIADSVHPTFTKSFLASTRFDKFEEPDVDWGRAVEFVGKHHSLHELGDYWRLLWELSASCPVPYLSDSALPKGLVAREHQRLQGYKFRLVVDGIELRKPVSLHNNPGGFSAWPIKEQSLLVYGRNLKFHGYLIVQEGTQLKPDELRGILIRIKDIGVGYYDASMLDYRFNEGPRAKWLTGEIFVEEGLEDALNIDRDSFNRFHPEFRAVQEHIHDLLRAKVFPESYKQIEVRSQKKASARSDKRTGTLASVISNHVGKDVIVRQSVSAPSKKGAEPRVEIKETTKQMVLEVSPSAAAKKSARMLHASIMTVFEVAMREKTLDARRATFDSLLTQLLKGW